MRSVLGQTFRDFELIVVNDGSTDSSPEIVEKFMSACPNIRMIHKPNGGVASARQAGSDLARGKYIIHVDPDDYVEPDWLEKLHAKALETDADVVICNYYEEQPSCSRCIDVCSLNALNPRELKICIADETIWACLWNKLLKTEIIRNSGVAFEPGINFHEDRLYFYRLLQSIQKIAYVKDYLYHYNRHNGSSALNNQSKTTLVQMWNARLLIMECEKDPEMKAKLSRILVTDNEVYNLINYPGVTKEEFRRFITPFRDEALRIAKSGKRRYIHRFDRFLKYRRIGRLASRG